MRSFLNCLLGPRKASVTTSNGYSKEKSPQDQSIGTCRLLGSSDKPGEQPNGCADAKHNSALVCYQGQHGEVAVLQAGVNGFQPSASPLNTFEQGAYAAGDAEPSTVNALKLQALCAEDICECPPQHLLKHLSISVTSPLGQGAYGMVLKGTYNGCNVAIKVLATAVLDHAALRETLLGPRFVHPNLIATYSTRCAPAHSRVPQRARKSCRAQRS